jgi:hypothetical protein
MPATKIPKLSRNKYNYVQGADGNKYVTQTQLMMSSGGSGSGGGGGGNNPSSHVTAAINQAMYDKGILTIDDIKTVNGYSLIGTGDIEITTSGTIDLSAYMTKQDMTAYVSKVELDNAAYLNQSYLNDKMSDYVTRDNFDAVLTTYATKAYVTAKCQEVQANAYAYTDSKTKELSFTTYSDVESMIMDIIAYMKTTGELVSASYVEDKISESRV